MYSREYREYLTSPEWAAKKRSAYDNNRAKNYGEIRCDDCGTRKGPFSVHHAGDSSTAYRHLGNEPLNTLRVLCWPCHDAADDRRRAGLDDRPCVAFTDTDEPGWGIVEEWLRPSRGPVPEPPTHKVEVTPNKSPYHDEGLRELLDELKFVGSIGAAGYSDNEENCKPEKETV